MKKISKRIIAGFMALVMVFGVVLSGQITVQAKGRSKYKARISYCDRSYSCFSSYNGAKTYIQNKKGKANYTITLKRSQCTGDAEGPLKNTGEIDVYIDNILKDHKAKDIKITNVVVKCDGKKVKLDKKKITQFVQKGEDGTKRYRLCIFYYYNKKNWSAKPKAFTWNETLSVSFQINIKK